MYLRETRRTNRDGSVVAYLQLAHNERHPDTGSSVAKVIHNFGRAEQVDRDALARLVSSISRFLTPEQATAAAAGAEVDIVDSRPLGGSPRSRPPRRVPRRWPARELGTARSRTPAEPAPPGRRSPPGQSCGSPSRSGCRSPGAARCARAASTTPPSRPGCSAASPASTHLHVTTQTQATSSDTP